MEALFGSAGVVVCLEIQDPQSAIMSPIAVLPWWNFWCHHDHRHFDRAVAAGGAGGAGSRTKDAVRQQPQTNRSGDAATPRDVRPVSLGRMGWMWVGDPERGTDKKQAGGWIYNILDYMELSSVRNMGLGLTGTAHDNAIVARCKTPLAAFICPTRRAVITYPDLHPGSSLPYYRSMLNTVANDRHGRTNRLRAINVGDTPQQWISGPTDVTQGDNETWWQTQESTIPLGGDLHGNLLGAQRGYGGQVATHKQHLSDREKIPSPDHYTDGQDGRIMRMPTSVTTTTRIGQPIRAAAIQSESAQRTDAHAGSSRLLCLRHHDGHLRQRACRRLAGRFLRRFGPCDELHSRPGSPPLPWQPPGPARQSDGSKF